MLLDSRSLFSFLVFFAAVWQRLSRALVSRNSAARRELMHTIDILSGWVAVLSEHDGVDVVATLLQYRMIVYLLPDSIFYCRPEGDLFCGRGVCTAVLQ